MSKTDINGRITYVNRPFKLHQSTMPAVLTSGRQRLKPVALAAQASGEADFVQFQEAQS